MRISDWSSTCALPISCACNGGRNCRSDGLCHPDGRPCPAHSGEVPRRCQWLYRLANCPSLDCDGGVNWQGSAKHRALASQFSTAYDLARTHDASRSRSEERSKGKEGVSTCRSRWAPVHV